MLSFHGVSIMPIAYLSIAISAVIIHALLSKMNKKYSLIKIIGLNHVFHIITLSVVSYLLLANLMSGLLSIVFYVYISLFALVTVTYFYQYCQSLLTIREAKRIYAYIGSGAIAGGVFGGYFTSVFIPYTGNSGLVLASIILLLISAYIIYELHQSFNDDTINSLNKIDKNQKALSSFRSITNKHVFNISMIIGLGVLVSKLVDYQFNFIAYENIVEEKALTAFFGFWFSTINVIGLLIQVFLVSRIIDRFGVTKSISVMPIFLLFGSGLLLIFPILALAVLVKLIEGSLKQSIYKTSTEINIMPLGPSLRNSAKTLVDVVVDSLATGLAGVLIYFLINKGNLPFIYIGGLTLCSILFWIYFILQSKKTYTLELAQMVSGKNQNMLESERVGSTAKKYYLDDYLKNNKHSESDPKLRLLNLTKHKKADIRKSAILRYITDYGSKSIIDLNHCTEDPSISVRKTVFFAMIRQSKREEDINNIYNNQSVTNKIIITSALAESVGNNTKQKRIYRIHSRIDDAFLDLGEHLNIKKSTALYGEVFKAITISKYYSRYFSISEAICNSFDDQLQKEALKSIGYGKAERLLEKISIEDIAEDNRPIFYRVLAVFPNKLLAKARQLDIKGSRHINKYLSAFKHVDNQRHVDFLFSLLDKNNLRTKRIALHTINESRKLHPHLSFNHRRNNRRLKIEIKLLKGLSAAIVKVNSLKNETENTDIHRSLDKVIKGLIRQANKSILTVFTYLSLITENNEMKMIYNAIKSNRKEAALDYLDGILDYKLRKFTLPVLDLVINKRFTPLDLERIKQSMYSEKKLIVLFRKLKDPNIPHNYFEALRKIEEDKVLHYS